MTGKHILKYLASLRFTVLLISLLGVMFLLGLWIPQTAQVHGKLYDQWKANAPALVAVLEALKFTTIYTSPLMLALWGFFFLNLSLVMWQRLPLLKNKVALSEARIADPATAPGYPFRNSYPIPEHLEAGQVMDSLRRRGYSLLGGAEGCYGVKNRLAPLAFALFHLSFFLILIGGLTSVYTKFYGVLDLAEGEAFEGRPAQFNKAPVLAKIGSPPDSPFLVKSIVPQVTGDTATGIKVQILDEKGKEHLLNINRPYEDGSTSYVFKDLGVAPLMVVKDAAGRELEGSFVKLNVMKGKGDSFMMAGYLFRVRFYPDYVIKDGKPATRSEEFNNPMFALTVERQGRQVAQALVPPKGELAFEGRRLEIRQMPFWVRLSVIKEHGLPILYAGFAAASLAVIWRFMLYRREILVAVREEGGVRRLVVAGRSEFYKSLAEDEFNELFRGKVLGLAPEEDAAAASVSVA